MVVLQQNKREKGVAADHLEKNSDRLKPVAFQATESKSYYLK